MNDTQNTDTGEQTLQSIFEEMVEPCYVVRSSTAILESIVQAADDDTPTLHILASVEDLRTVRQQFRLATNLAELCNQDRFTLTPVAPAGRGTVLVGDERAYAVAYIDGEQLLFEAVSYPETLIETCSRYRGTETFDLRAPPWEKVSKTLTETFNTDVADDFRLAIQEWTETVDEQAIDEVDIALLIACTHKLLLYDLSTWGEDLGVASKATFSRAKTALADAGVLATEKVPIEVGRPRLRLTLTDEYASLSFIDLLDAANDSVAP